MGKGAAPKTKRAAVPAPPALDAQALAQRTARLKADLMALAGTIGERHHLKPEALEAAAQLIERELKVAGYAPKRQSFKAKGQLVSNIEVEIKGSQSPEQIVVIGAHYDTAYGTPGADDNGTGVVGVLELARAVKGLSPAKTLRFVLFVNEEPPFFQTELMGSLVYARRCAANKEQIVAMLSLEMLGFYRDEPGTQQYPPGLGLFYPNKGDFLGFVTRVGSSSLNKQTERAFVARQEALPTERLSAPELVTGVGFSDHWSFWQAGYDAVMVTDTAFMRNPHYHEATDTPETIDYARLTQAVTGLEGSLWALVGGLVKAP